ncbi:MAG TPA: hypothetical protein VGD45_28285 [Steroidobacter sp.]|uniref:hypothetical protein n=1 Tax=Steroidobacter sp. TaxID=1978227 RepID=UPI002ED78DFD
MEFNVLVAEPSNAVWTAIAQGIRGYQSEASILRVKDGEQALRFLFHRGLLAEEPQTPSLVVLAGDLPIIPAETIVARLRQHPRTHAIPVIVVWQQEVADAAHADEQQQWLQRQRSLLIAGPYALDQQVIEAARQLCGEPLPAREEQRSGT